MFSSGINWDEFPAKELPISPLKSSAITMIENIFIKNNSPFTYSPKKRAGRLLTLNNSPTKDVLK